MKFMLWKYLSPDLGHTLHTMFQGYGSSDLRDKTDKEKKAALVARIKVLLARRKKDKLKGKPTKGFETQIKTLRGRIGDMGEGE